MSGYIVGIDIANMIIFAFVGVFATINAVRAIKTKTSIGKLLAVHCVLAVIMSIMFLILQGQWSLQNYGTKFTDYTNLGWSVFETINAISLLFYSLAVRVLLSWQTAIDDIEHCVNQSSCPSSDNLADGNNPTDKKESS